MPIYRPVIALAALFAAFYVSVSYEFGDPDWQLEFTARPASAQSEDEGNPAYDLSHLVVLDRAIRQIHENYVDPSRINWRRMVGAAMEAVQQQVPELLVQVERDDNELPTRLLVQVNEAEQAFELRDVDSLWQTAFKFRDIFRFIQPNLLNYSEFDDIEYAAINGMLSTLDPHSNLMRPEEYREMKLTTRGKFGGLGIVISVKDGHLVVVNPIPDTPAADAGIKPGDRVVQINLDSTVNMALQDAVDLLRGTPKSKVDLHIVREGWKAPRKFTLTRANIKVRSVDHKLLADRVGLIRIRNFQNTTDDEVEVALNDLRGEGRPLNGLILDLRDNPGGLLDQAIKIADRFVESGPIVTTVGYGDKLREPKMAIGVGTEEDYPLVVLTNRQSASASEIVAGALKNHKRAVVIGQQTFGKGSVQVIYDNKDDSALKLTIAQYLTPGDISIQSVGIVPDIATLPVVLTDEDTDFFRSESRETGEKDLEGHLDHESSQISKAVRSELTLRYLLDPKLAREIEDHPNDLIVDFEIAFARDLIASTDAGRRDAFLSDVRGVLLAKTEAEMAGIVAALAARGIVWTATPLTGRASSGPAPKAQITVVTEPAAGEIVAGEAATVTTTVRNLGPGALRNLHALTRSDNELFDGHELLFGTLEPGAEKTWALKLKAPRHALSRRDAVRIEFFEEGGHAPAEVKTRLSVTQLERPRFALSYALDDSVTGNGDGLIQMGEEVEVVLDVQNVGKGKSFGAQVALNAVEEDELRPVFIKRGRADLLELLPGQIGHARLSFRAKELLVKPDLPISIGVFDGELREGTSEKLTLLAVPRGEPVALERTRLTAKTGSELRLRGTPSSAAPVAHRAQVSRQPIRSDGRFGAWYRVPLERKLFAWVHQDDVAATPDGGEPSEPSGRIERAPLVGPPVITLSDHGKAETKSDSLTLSGEALAVNLVRDLLIYVNNKKVYFKSNARAEGDRALMRFSARLPLDAGANRITVIAREDEQLSSRQTLFVTREN